MPARRNAEEVAAIIILDGKDPRDNRIPSETWAMFEKMGLAHPKNVLTSEYCDQIVVTPTIDDIYGSVISGTPLLWILRDLKYCVSHEYDSELGKCLLFEKLVFHEAHVDPLVVQLWIPQFPLFEELWSALDQECGYIEACQKSGSADKLPTDEELLRLCIPVTVLVPKPHPNELKLR